MEERFRQILVVDDEKSMRHMLRLLLTREGYEVEEASSASAALDLLATSRFGAILCDIRMPGIDGHGFLREMMARGRSETVIMMSAYGSVDTAIACMKEGAYDYVSKPFKTDEVILCLRKAEERHRLQNENARLRRELILAHDRHVLVFRSAAMARVTDFIAKAADAEAPVLITGETGTGKEVVARLLHCSSRRSSGPFIAVNCSAMPAGIIESELFGHARGAFTGADREHNGLFAAADGGTLFLDEIGELPLELQPKLLRVLQEREVRRLGDSRTQPVDVRVISATVRNLAAEVQKGSFRSDLYFRLAVLTVDLPPLRERLEDVPLLLEHLGFRLAAAVGCRAPAFSAEAVRALQRYEWPGNVRELENVIARSLIFAHGGRIDLTDLPPEIASRSLPESLSLPQAVRRLEKDYIVRALRLTGGNRTRAARLLAISLRGLQYKLKELGLESAATGPDSVL